MCRFVSIGTNRRTLKKATMRIDAIRQCVIIARSAKKKRSPNLGRERERWEYR
jgi:hypothetical protein